MTIPERTITLANELRAAWLNDASPSGAFAWFARCLQAERDAHALAVHQIACLAEKPKPEDVAKVAAFVIAAARRAWEPFGTKHPDPPPEVSTGIAEAIIAAYGPLPDTPAIRTGSGLTEAQRAYSASRKWTDARDIKTLAADLHGAFVWPDSVEGNAFWHAIRDRLLEMAAALEASVEPPPDPRIAVAELYAPGRETELLAALDRATEAAP